MKLESISHWFQIVASFGVVVGLVLVYTELQQSHEIARAQLASETYSMFTEQSTAAYGESLHLIYARACESPTDLSMADLYVLHARFFDTINRLRRQINIGRTSSFYESENWRRFTGNISGIMDTYAGRHWWQSSRGWLEPELVEVGDELLESLGPPSCADKLRTYRESLPDGV